MKLNKFSLVDNNITVEKNSVQYDLKHCFFFVGMNYDIINQELSLRWIKGLGDGVTDNLPDELVFEFSGVSFLKARQRDLSRPYPPDEFLSVMGFTQNSRIDEFGGGYTHQPGAACNHLCLEFASGFALKFAAEEGALSTKVNI